MKPNSIKPSSPKPSVSYVLFVLFLTKTNRPKRHKYCSSYTYSTEKELVSYKSFLQNEPNFQTNWSTLSAVIAETYNKYPSWKLAKTNPIEPNTNPIEKRTKFNANFFHYRDLQRKPPLTAKNNEPKTAQK